MYENELTHENVNDAHVAHGRDICTIAAHDTIETLLSQAEEEIQELRHKVKAKNRDLKRARRKAEEAEMKSEEIVSKLEQLKFALNDRNAVPSRKNAPRLQFVQVTTMQPSDDELEILEQVEMEEEKMVCVRGHNFLFSTDGWSMSPVN